MSAKRPRTLPMPDQLPPKLNDTVMRAVVAALKGTAHDEVVTYAMAKFIATAAVQAALPPTPDQRTMDLDELQDRLEWMTQHLAECYRQSGADTDGNEDWRLAPFAMSEVRRLRAEYDAASAIVRELEANRKRNK